VKQYNDTAIVLTRTDYGERDRILTLLAREHGKIRLIAKGVRAAKSKLAGGIELFSESQIGVIEGKGSLGTLTSSRLEAHYGRLAQDISKTMLAYDFLKAINKITEDGAGQEYYDLLNNALVALDQPDSDAALVQTWFDLQVLKASGSLPNLITDAANQPLKEVDNYRFDYDAQCFVADSVGSFTVSHVKLLRLNENHPRPPRVTVNEHIARETAHLVHNLLQLNVLS
jgi:DNA repair protein RecO